MTGCIVNNITKIQFTWVDILLYKIYHIQTGGQVGFLQLITLTVIVKKLHFCSEWQFCCSLLPLVHKNVTQFLFQSHGKKTIKNTWSSNFYYCLLSYFKWRFIVYSLNVLSRSSSLPLCAAIPLIILLNLHVKPEIGCATVNSPHQISPELPEINR